jgi:hypothetical protein
MTKRKVNPKSLKNLRPDTSEFKEEYCEKLIDHMATGRSFESFGATIEPKRGRSTLYLWVESHPEFKEAKEIGTACGLNYYENLKASGEVGIVPKQLKEQGSKGIDLQSIHWTLRLRFRDVYNEQKTIDHKSSDGSMSPAKMSDEELMLKCMEYGIE